jgi:tRNA A-37 threonylcarbamoyl transferase component Bud32
MLLLDTGNAEAYLRDAGRLDPDDRVEITALPGGVSNQVLYIAFPAEPTRDFVLKQAREQLRVADPWFCGVDRIWREVEVLRTCEQVLSGALASSATSLVRTPRILFEDQENYCFCMEAAPREHTVWKRQLLTGDSATEKTNGEIATQCGRLLGLLHRGTWGDVQIAAALDDRRIFDELRLDPYYRTLARRFPADATVLAGLVEAVLSRRLCLVHADFSPKNLLVYPGGLMMVDFETGHYGDPAFDLGFFLTHLVLKAFYHAPRHEPLLQLTARFWAGYRETLASPAGGEDLERHAVRNFAGCAWARLDGKSPVEYLTDPRRRDQVRTLCRGILADPPATWDETLDRCLRLLNVPAVSTQPGC